MAKVKNQNTAKSLVLLIVTGIILAAATLCWFAISDRSTVEDVDTQVENAASSTANIYYGVDRNGEIAIRKEDVASYKRIDTTTIELKDMFPGAEYFYMAEFSNCTEGRTVSLSFEGIKDTKGNLSQSVEVDRKIVYVDSSTSSETDLKKSPQENSTSKVFLNQIDNEVFNCKVTAAGKYKIYYSFKLEEKTTSEKENSSVIIENVNAVVSD